MSKTILILLCLSGTQRVAAQANETCLLRFRPSWGNTPLVLNDSTYRLQNDGTVKLRALRFYISDVRLLARGLPVFREENSFHLLDAENPASLCLTLDLPADLAYDQLNFNLGIDSLTNTGGAFGGDLDPVNGMYWAWHSGYINAKLEGICSLCPSREKEFQFHLGGYQTPFNAMQRIELPVAPSPELEVKVDLFQFFAGAQMQERDHVMSPGEAAWRLSALLRSCIHSSTTP